jgi:D-amino peptidase
MASADYNRRTCYVVCVVEDIMRRRFLLLLTLLAAWTITATRAQQGPKVLLLYDMEGVTDAVRPPDVSMGSPSYPATRESLTEDVNAAIRGLLKAGAREIVITDGHGSGNPDPDYLIDKMPSGARFDIRDAPYDPYIEAMDDTFDAMVAVAMHGRAGGKAFLAHTYNGHTRWVMAGHDMNESMLIAASAARFNIPLILVTGDDVLKDEIKVFSPATEYVTVKKAVSVSSAEARPRADVSRDIEATAERALRNRKSVSPWKPTEITRPFENQFAYILPEQAALASMFPHATPVNNKTIKVPAANFVDAYLAFRALAAYTGLTTQRMMLSSIRQMEGGADLIAKAQNQLPSREQRTFEPTAATLDRGALGPGRHGYR